MSAQETHHHEAGHSGELKSKTAFRSSFWFVIILVGLFIAALNFVKSTGDEHHESAEGTHTEQHATEAHATGEHAEAPGAAATHEVHEAAATTAPAVASDSAATEAHQTEEAHH